MSEAFLDLYRAARDFTRRAVDGRSLERAALVYAESRGYAPLREREASRKRITELEGALRRIAEARDTRSFTALDESVQVERKVLG